MSGVPPSARGTDEEFFKFRCTYCLREVDMGDDEALQRVIAWHAPQANHNQVFTAALPVLLNEWAHADCVYARAEERQQQLQRRDRRTS